MRRSLTDTVDQEPAAELVRVRRRHDERGASLVEYALLVALIAVVLVAAVQLVGESTGASLDGSGSTIDVATTP